MIHCIYYNTPSRIVNGLRTQRGQKKEFFMEKKTYRCVSRTKRSFETALATLSKTTPLPKITVKALCEEAQLSRNAFYFHYADIDALVEDIENNLTQEIAALLEEFKAIGFPECVTATVRRLPDLFIRHKDVTMMLLDSPHSKAFRNRINQMFSDFFFQYFSAFHNTTYREGYDYFYAFLSSGFYGILNRYLHDPEAMPRERFTALTYTLIKRLIIIDDPRLDISKLRIN